jgi:hypothetical protein
MAKARPAKPPAVRTAARSAKPTRPPSPAWRVARRALLHVTIGAALVAGLAYAASAARAYVEQADAVSGPRQLTVVLENRPLWMSDYLTRQIAATLPRRPASPFDRSVLVAAYKQLRANPWVREVRQVRRAYGDAPGDTLVIDCEYRAPAALVQWGQSYWMVDNDGTKLPSPYAAAELPQVTHGRDGHVALRIVTGVRAPPPEAGRPWIGDDLAAALDTVKLFDGKPYMDEVTAVDMTNFGGRVSRSEPQVVLQTCHDTQVWWGRPPLASDFVVEVPVAHKLATLAAVVKQYGRIDGGKPWIDVRFDTGLLPADPPGGASPPARP